MNKCLNKEMTEWPKKEWMSTSLNKVPTSNNDFFVFFEQTNMKKSDE